MLSLFCRYVLPMNDCHYLTFILLSFISCSAVAYASSISLSSHIIRVAASPLIYLYTVFFTDCVVPQLQRHHQPLYVISAFFLSSKIQMTLLYIDSIDYPLTRGNPYILSGTPPILLSCLEVWFMCIYVFAKFIGHPVWERWKLISW